MLRNADQPAIIIVNNNGADEQCAIGPFPTGTEASRFGFANLSGQDWYWLPLNIGVDYLNSIAQKE